MIGWAYERLLFSGFQFEHAIQSKRCVHAIVFTADRSKAKSEKNERGLETELHSGDFLASISERRLDCISSFLEATWVFGPTWLCIIVIISISLENIVSMNAVSTLLKPLAMTEHCAT